MDETDFAAVRRLIADLELVPVHETPEHLLRAALDSVIRQVYENWELCLADDASIASDSASAGRGRCPRTTRQAGAAG